MLRVAAVTVAALACSACASESAISPIGPPMGLGVHGQLQAASAKPVASPPSTTSAKHAVPTHNVKQTLGGKVLSAIALERVTGRKPDPRRFKELR